MFVIPIQILIVYHYTDRKEPFGSIANIQVRIKPNKEILSFYGHWKKKKYLIPSGTMNQILSQMSNAYIIICNDIISYKSLKTDK